MAYRCSSTIKCGDSITVSISADGDVYSFGSCSRFSHGHKEKTVFPPKRIDSLKIVDYIIPYV